MERQGSGYEPSWNGPSLVELMPSRLAGYHRLLALPASVAAAAPFATYLAASSLTLFGDSLFEMAVIWHIMEATGSAAVVGGIAAAIQLPVVLSAAFAGVLADRWSRKKLIVFSKVARGSVVASVFLFYRLGVLTPWHLLAVGVLDSFIQVLGGAASTAVIPNLVDRERVMTANSWLEGIRTGTPIAAQGLAGLIIAATGIAGAAGITSTLFLAGAGLFALIADVRYGGGGSKGRRLTGRVFAVEFWNGLRQALRSRAVRWLMLVGLVTNLLIAGPIFVLMPFYASTVLEAGASGYGYMKAAMTVGSLIGALVVGRFGRRMTVGAWLGVGIGVLGALLASLSFSPSLWVACILWAVVGICLPIVNIPVFTALQLSTPDDRRARTMTVFMTLAGASTPASLALVGQAVSVAGIEGTFLATGLLVTLVGIGAWIWRTRFEIAATS